MTGGESESPASRAMLSWSFPRTVPGGTTSGRIDDGIPSASTIRADQQFVRGFHIWLVDASVISATARPVRK
jgi:hypothetical protein